MNRLTPFQASLRLPLRGTKKTPHEHNGYEVFVQFLVSEDQTTSILGYSGESAVHSQFEASRPPFGGQAGRYNDDDVLLVGLNLCISKAFDGAPKGLKSHRLFQTVPVFPRPVLKLFLVTQGL